MVFNEHAEMPFVFFIIICAGILYYYQRGKTGKKINVRTIPALEALDELVGRAAEMGGSIVTSTGGGTGINTPRGPAHLAGLAIIGYVAQLAGKMGIKVLCASQFPEQVPIAQETIRQGYFLAGREDLYYDELVRYYPFGSAFDLGVQTMVVEENAKSCFWVGWWWQESIYPAIAGRKAGCMQMGGNPSNDGSSMLMATCDYMLLSEELYVAGAYLSKDEPMLGMIVGEDVGKFAAIISIVLFIILTAIGINWNWIV